MRAARAGGKVALVLGGGGITGGVYEIGVLKALDDFLVNRSVNDLDIYIGVSAGGLIAAAMAAGMPPRRMVSVLSRRRGPFPPFRRMDIYGLNWKEYRERLARIPNILGSALWRSFMPVGRDEPADLLGSLSQVVPSGMLDISPLGRYAERLLRGAGLPTEFGSLGRELYLPALNLDTGHLTVFGEVGTRHVPIAQAVCASAAIPFLFGPVRIDGQDYVDGGMDRNLPIEVAIRHGASLVVAIHPLVPLMNVPRARGDASAAGSYLSGLGGTTVLDQVYRTLVHGREREHVESVRRRHPEVPVLLVEPSFDDMVMFQFNVMRYSVRQKLAQHGYATTRRLLLGEIDEWRQAFRAHGIEVRDEIPERPSLDPDDMATPTLDWNSVVDAVERLPWVRRWLEESPEADPWT
ncbi:patatin-like phospholipase family protein [Myxococcota bacterium]|nr:patatin-like phospholipase family protein [Myxococcota bacterium]